MALFPAEEIEAALLNFHDALNESGRTGDWSIFGDRLMPDATMVETVLGTFGKREAIVTAISNALTRRGDSRWDALTRFPLEEYVIDDNRGWVWSLWSPRFSDPGDGGLFQDRAFVLLKYKGNGRFFFMETVYNPNHLRNAMIGFRKAEAAASAGAEARDAMLAAREAQAREMAPMKLDEK